MDPYDDLYTGKTASDLGKHPKRVTTVTPHFVKPLKSKILIEIS